MSQSEQRPKQDTPAPALSRRRMLAELGGGFGSVALSYLLAQEASAQDAQSFRKRKELPSALSPKEPMFPAKAKSVIFLFMGGGPSHVDTFDYKPMLTTYNGKATKGGRAVMASPFQFLRRGGSGLPIAEIFPQISSVSDELCLIHSVYSQSGEHTRATLEVNTGKILPGFASMGAWATYGLGTVNQNLPAFVVLHDGNPSGGSLNWSNGYLPAAFQGTEFHTQGSPIRNLQPVWKPKITQQRAMLDMLAEVNMEHLETHPGDGDLEARIAAYELAYRMQLQAPQVVNVEAEPKQVKSLYGLDRPETQSFGRKCLLARRLVQNGVRFVQIFHNGWDSHNNIGQEHRRRGTEIDKPIAALIRDLKQSGMLDSTLIVWAGEFGRTPAAQGSGRDHHSAAHTVWMAGGGVRGGVRVGETDELGERIASERHPMRDMHATILQAMGIDNRLLTFLHNGRMQRLTDTGGTVIPGVLA